MQSRTYLSLILQQKLSVNPPNQKNSYTPQRKLTYCLHLGSEKIFLTSNMSPFSQFLRKALAVFLPSKQTSNRKPKPRSPRTEQTITIPSKALSLIFPTFLRFRFCSREESLYPYTPTKNHFANLEFKK